MDSKKIILKEIEQLEALLKEILDFIRFLKTKEAQKKFEFTVLSEWHDVIIMFFMG